MKNLMTIFSVVVLFTFAMTTIGCDEKKGGETLTVEGKPTDFKDSTSGEIKAAYIGDTPATTPALTIKDIPTTATKVSLIQVKKDAAAFTITKLKEVDKAASGDTTIAYTTWSIAAAGTTTDYIEYEFHVLATTVTYEPPAVVAADDDFTKVKNKILAVKDGETDVVVGSAPKILDGKVKK